LVKMIMHGCNGRMGRMITDIVKTDDAIEIVAGIDIFDEGKNEYPVFKSMAECDVPADVVVDFGNAAATDGLLAACIDKKLPLVLCTTGLSEEQLNSVKEASKVIPMFKAANMSLGINLLQKILRENASVLAEAGFDIEIVEKHHKMKLDAPSGTAIALADSVNDGLANKKEYVYDRSGRRMLRPENEIGISAVRGGTIVGEHDVIFAGTDEVVTFSHTAYSRGVFAKGAIEAAKYMAGKSCGMYDMSDVIENR